MSMCVLSTIFDCRTILITITNEHSAHVILIQFELGFSVRVKCHIWLQRSIQFWNWLINPYQNWFPKRHLASSPQTPIKDLTLIIMKFMPTYTTWMNLPCIFHNMALQIFHNKSLVRKFCPLKCKRHFKLKQIQNCLYEKYNAGTRTSMYWGGGSDEWSQNVLFSFVSLVCCGSKHFSMAYSCFCTCTNIHHPSL